MPYGPPTSLIFMLLITASTSSKLNLSRWVCHFEFFALPICLRYSFRCTVSLSFFLVVAMKFCRKWSAFVLSHAFWPLFRVSGENGLLRLSIPLNTRHRALFPSVSDVFPTLFFNATALACLITSSVSFYYSSSFSLSCCVLLERNFSHACFCLPIASPHHHCSTTAPLLIFYSW